MKNILYIAQFNDACGYGSAARNFLKLLDYHIDKNKYKLCVFPLNFEKQKFISDLEEEIIQKYCLSTKELSHFINNNEYILLLHSIPTLSQIDNRDMPVKQCLINKNCIKKINFISWETDECPKLWKEIYNNSFDVLLVSCQWNKEVFQKSISIPVHYISIPMYEYYNVTTKKSDVFRIFSMSQWNYRKGFDILLRAYYQEFFNNADTELYIKTYRNETLPGSNEEAEKNAIIQEIKNYKQQSMHYGNLSNAKVVLRTGFVESSGIEKIYRTSDVFCLPTRGEGFGMTIAQAALSGIPCIVPDKGGHLDYLCKENNYFIESRYEPPYGLYFSAYSSKDMNIVEPSLSSTRKQLRNCYNDWLSGTLHSRSLKVKNFSKTSLEEIKIFHKFMEIIK